MYNIKQHDEISKLYESEFAVLIRFEIEQDVVTAEPWSEELNEVEKELVVLLFEEQEKQLRELIAGSEQILNVLKEYGYVKTLHDVSYDWRDSNEVWVSFG